MFSRSEVKDQGHSEAKALFWLRDTLELTAVRPLSMLRRHTDRRCGVDAALIILYSLSVCSEIPS